jgi:hypothetical protein
MKVARGDAGSEQLGVHLTLNEYVSTVPHLFAADLVVSDPRSPEAWTREPGDQRRLSELMKKGGRNAQKGQRRNNQLNLSARLSLPHHLLIVPCSSVTSWALKIRLGVCSENRI